jgi:hypothetical protein
MEMKMAKIKLGERPKSFARVVKFTDLDGTEMTVPVTYKYRTRKEYGAWIDAMPPEPTAMDAMKDGKFSSETYIEMVSAWNANKIMQCVDSWGLDEEFSPANVKQTCDEMPACAEAITREYQGACLEGRLGN